MGSRLLFLRSRYNMGRGVEDVQAYQIASGRSRSDIIRNTAKKTVPETVLKLTQVGEMNILRRSRELS